MHARTLTHAAGCVKVGQRDEFLELVTLKSIRFFGSLTDRWGRWCVFYGMMNNIWNSKKNSIIKKRSSLDIKYLHRGYLDCSVERLQSLHGQHLISPIQSESEP